VAMLLILVLPIALLQNQVERTQPAPGARTAPGAEAAPAS
jgi:hypothetical protein